MSRIDIEISDELDFDVGDCCIVIKPDGTIGKTIGEQVELVYQNIKTVLSECGMGYENIAKITVYLTSPDYIETHRAIQQNLLGDVVPASTLLIVSRLARSELLVEVEAVAAID